jgi:hypothetical protein
VGQDSSCAPVSTGAMPGDPAGMTNQRCIRRMTWIGKRGLANVDWQTWIGKRGLANQEGKDEVGT